MRSPLLRHFFGCASLLLPLSGFASPPEESSFSVNAGISLMHFDYREYLDDGSEFNREKGNLPGLSISGDYNMGNGWALTAALNHHGGTIDYKGQDSLGTTLTTETGERITDLSVQLNKQLTLPNEQALSIFGGIGQRKWRRDVHSTPSALGLLEHYNWQYLYAGAKLHLVETNGANFAIEGRVIRTRNPEITIDFHGIYDNVALPLGEHAGFRLSLPVEFDIAQTLPVKIEAYWEQGKFGRSQPKALTLNNLPAGGTVYEPRSETNTYGLSLLLSKSF